MTSRGFATKDQDKSNTCSNTWEVGANPGRRDKWSVPVRTRHVLVRVGRPTALPEQGLVVEWRKRGRQWWALVAFVDTQFPDHTLYVRWVPADVLAPVPWVDPNAIRWPRN